MRRPKQKGSVLIEFALCSILLIPVTIGCFALGVGLTRYLQASSICRSAGSMFVRGADFSKPGMQAVLVRIAKNIGLGSGTTINPNGRSVVTVTQLMRIGTPQCDALPADVPCTNRGRVVITKQLRLGNDSLRASGFGSPNPAMRSSDGAYPVNFYLTDPAAAVPSFGTAAADNMPTAGSPLDLRAGELCYASEVFTSTQDINVFPQVINLQGLYSRNYF